MAQQGTTPTIGFGSSATCMSLIPEPTSATLILLGVAGLALKRKQRG